MKAFPTQKIKETQMKIFLMNSIHRTLNVFNFSQMKFKVFFFEKENSNTIDAIHENIRSLSKYFDSRLYIL